MGDAAYSKKYYRLHKAEIAAGKAHRQKHDLDYRLNILLATIRHRCESPKFIGWKYYGGKGVRNFLTLADLRFLWERDGAASMKRPSVDRIDNAGDYELSNVRFIPLGENIARANRTNSRRPAQPATEVA